MNYQENLEQLLKITNYNETKNSIRLKFNDDYTLFPFQTREPNRPKFNSGFKNIISEFSRIINEVKLADNFDVENLLNEIINNDKIETRNDEDSIYLQALLKDYIINQNNELKVVHPYLFKYVTPTKDLSRKGEVDIACFFNDVFFNDNIEMKTYFNSKDESQYSNYNILTSMIIDNLPELEHDSIQSDYIGKLNYVTDVFKEDIEFALDYKDFLNKNIENIFAYYYFFYITQLSLKIFKKENDLNSLEELYYLLDSENASKNRKTINNGYGLIKSQNRYLLYKIYTIDYVNKILGTKGLIYSELIEYVNNLEPKEYDSFIIALKGFIKIYNKTKDNFEEIESDTFEELFNLIYARLLEIKDKSTNSRYVSYFEDIGKKYFLKNRGRYGSVLNLNQDMLLTITALCVKKDKIKLKDLFVEFEKRGIFLDNSSKSEVENLLTKLNYIDKKSDSGEAQYVRRIL